MSWNLETQEAVELGAVDAAVDSLTFEGASPEVAHQIAAARQSVKELVASGALGTAGHVSVSMAGHANAQGCELIDGEDTPNIVVRIVKAAEPAKAPEPEGEATEGSEDGEGETEAEEGAETPAEETSEGEGAAE
jgi:hypothetical protein